MDLCILGLRPTSYFRCLVTQRVNPSMANAVRSGLYKLAVSLKVRLSSPSFQSSDPVGDDAVSACGAMADVDDVGDPCMLGKDVTSARSASRTSGVT